MFLFTETPYFSLKVQVKSKTRKMQRHPRQNGQKKTKATSGGRKSLGRKVKNKEVAPLLSSTEPVGSSKVPLPLVKTCVEGNLKQLALQPRIITLGTSEESEPSLDYSIIDVAQHSTSTVVVAPQKCVTYSGDLEPPSQPSSICEDIDPSYPGSPSKTVGISSDPASSTEPTFPSQFDYLVQMLELESGKISLSEKLSNLREGEFFTKQRKSWQLEEELHTFMKSSIEQESQDGMMWRERIISELEMSLRSWVKGNETQELAEGQVSSRILPYGSFRLKVVDKHSDLDLLAVLPQQISREEFFTNFPTLLMKMEVVKELRVLSAAFVPVVKFRYRGMEVDLTAACLTTFKSIPMDNLFLSQFPTEQLDPRCLRR